VANIGYLTWGSSCFPADVGGVTHWLCEWQWLMFQISVGEKWIGQLNLRPLYCQGNKVLLQLIPRQGGLFRRSWHLQKILLFLGFQFRIFSADTNTPAFLPFLWIYLHVYSARLTLRRLMSYIYGAPILDVSRSHTTTQHSR